MVVLVGSGLVGTARALCTDANTRAYRNADCSLTDEKSCENGCEAGACLSAPVETVVIDPVVEDTVVSDSKQSCDLGLACLDANRKGYRTSDCTFSNVQACPYGCSGGILIRNKAYKKHAIRKNINHGTNQRRKKVSAK